jgi:hypothetical protein
LATLNHDKTHVILITNGDFPNLSKDHAIPNVKANAEMLRQTLTEYVGIPEKNIHSFSDKTAANILEEFQRIAKNCSGKETTLIAYYVGHGISETGLGLFWTTHDTKYDGNDLIFSTAIATSDIIKLMERCNAERKILISDCCYAADFLKGMQGDMNAYIQKNITSIKGTFYMFSSGPDSESTFPEEKNDSPTFFTEALIRSLKEGIEPEMEFCTIGKIYTKVEETIGRLRKEYNKPIPDPAKRIDGKADEYILYINPKYRNVAEIELDAIFENPNRAKLFNWISEHSDHPRFEDAIERLKSYDSAEEEIKKVDMLPKEQKGAAFLELASKFKKIKMPELAKMAMSAYGNEKGLSAQREQLDGSQSEDTASIRTAVDASARQV